MKFHIFHHPDAATAEHQRRVERTLGEILTAMETVMLDTSKLLAAATRATTDSASLRALCKSTYDALTSVQGQLAAAIAANDQAGIAQAQTDLDTATKLLNTDSDQTDAALTANVPGAKDPAPVNDPAPAAAPAANPAAPAAT